jgi:hypothetical protein
MYYCLGAATFHSLFLTLIVATLPVNASSTLTLGSSCFSPLSCVAAVPGSSSAPAPAPPPPRKRSDEPGCLLLDDPCSGEGMHAADDFML